MDKPKSKFWAFTERRPVKLVMGLAALGLAYAFASWAIDSGSLLDYAITLLLIFVGLRELVDVMRKKH